MEKIKKESNTINNIAYLVQASQLFYKALPIGEFDEHIVRIVERLIKQKELFIKEIANATDSDVSALIPENKNLFESYRNDITHRCDESLSHQDVEDCISMLIEIERELYEKYSAYLLKEKPDEVTKMILRNQSNEIKRDIRILRNLLEYA